MKGEVMENEDLLRDDMAVIRLIKNDLMEMLKRIERNIESGTLRSVDRVLLRTRYMAMEMYLDEILTPDWRRLTEAVGSDQPMPRSASYAAWLTQPPLRTPTNPATHEAMGTPL